MKWEQEKTEDEGTLVASVILGILMLMYVIVGTRLETKGCGFGHETGVVIIVGMLVSAVLDLLDTEKIGAFNPKVLFEFGLPMILYAAGFNMRRKRFFDNINNISMFGILSTVACFIILSALTLAVFDAGLISKYTFDEQSGSWSS